MIAVCILHIKIRILHLNCHILRGKFIFNNFMLCAQIAQREENLCPLTCLGKLSMRSFIIVPIPHFCVGVVYNDQLKLNILFHGIKHPEGNDRIVPKLVGKNLLRSEIAQFQKCIAEGMGIRSVELHPQGCNRILRMYKLRIYVYAFGNTTVSIA